MPALTGFSTTASRGSMFGREINGDAPEAAFSATVSGFWLDTKPIDRFETTTTGGTKVSAYNTSSAGANTYGLWRDRSGWGWNGVAPDLEHPYFKNGWRYTSETFSRINVANAGGSTSAFYIAVAFAPYNYYGTIYSDLGSVGANVGFRLSHTGDGNGVIAQYIFDAGNGTSRVSVAVDAGHAVGANPANNVPVILEAWYDGANLFLRKDGGTTAQSASTVTVSAGSSTATINAITSASVAGDDVMSGGTEYYTVVATKNAVPNSTTRAAIYSYLVGRTTGMFAPMLGKPLAPSAGTAAPVPASNVALTGLQASAARGTLTPASGISSALTGLQASAARGTLAPSTAVPITGQAAAAAKGAPAVASSTINRLLAGTGNLLVAGAGNYLVSGSAVTDVSLGLTGQSVTTTRGALGASTAITLTGKALALARGSSTPGAAIVPGLPAVAARGTLTPNTTVAITGKSVSTGTGAVVALGVSAATASPVAAFGSAAFGTFAFAGDETDGYTVLNGAAMTAAAGVVRRMFDGTMDSYQLGAGAGTLVPVVGAAAALPTFPGHRADIATGTLAPSTSVPLTGLAAILSKAGVRPRQLQPADLRSAVVAIDFTEAVVPVTVDVAEVPLDLNTTIIPVAGTTGITV